MPNANEAAKAAIVMVDAYRRLGRPESGSDVGSFIA
jgi:hypothetical protein